MDAWRYGIYLLVFSFDISLVCCAHSFDIEVNTRRKIPYLRATMYYSLFISHAGVLVIKVDMSFVKNNDACERF